MATPDPRPIEAILFDLDDTLIDRDDALTRLNRHWYRTLPREHRPDGEDEFVARMFKEADRFTSPLNLYQSMIDIWPGSFSDPETALRAHNAIMPRMVRLESRTRGMLNYLRGTMPLGIVTNGGTRMQWAKVRNTGVDVLVDAVVVSEEFGAHKPDPAIFKHALNLIGTEASQTLFIGDNPVADICGAWGVGLRTAWMHHGREWHGLECRPDYKLDSVWEAPELVAR